MTAAPIRRIAFVSRSQPHPRRRDRPSVRRNPSARFRTYTCHGPTRLSSKDGLPGSIRAAAPTIASPARASHLPNAAMANRTVASTFEVKAALRVVQAFRPVGAAGIERTTLPTKSVGVHLAVSSDAAPILARLRGEVPAPAGGEAS